MRASLCTSESPRNTLILPEDRPIHHAKTVVAYTSANRICTEKAFLLSQGYSKSFSAIDLTTYQAVPYTLNSIFGLQPIR